MSNVYVAGNFNGSVDFNPGTGTDTKSSTYGSFLTKINADGSYGWTKVINKSWIFNLVISETGEIYYSGYYYETVDVDPNADTVSKTSAGLIDAYLIKLNADGSTGWIKTFGGTGNDKVRSVAVSVSGNVYLTGSFKETADLDPNAGVDTRTSMGGEDMFLTMLKSDGSTGWIKTFGGTGDDNGYSIAPDASGNLYIGGFFNATVDFDPGAGTTNYVSAAAIGSAFLMKMAE